VNLVIVKAALAYYFVISKQIESVAGWRTAVTPQIGKKDTYPGNALRKTAKLFRTVEAAAAPIVFGSRDI
jgi:hypothetical protein